MILDTVIKLHIINNHFNVTKSESSEVAPFQCSLGNEELFPLRALEIISKQPRFNIQTIRLIKISI